MKIYTKTGDKGQTSLVGGTRICKDDIRLEAYGTVDELNSFIGLLATHVSDEKTASYLTAIQNTLFDLGTVLAADTKKFDTTPYIKVIEKEIDIIEKEIDALDRGLPPLKTFIIPGGNQAASVSHICRTIARRTERKVCEMSNLYEVNNSISVYLNRLSDYFFILARFLNNKGLGEKLYTKREN